MNRIYKIAVLGSAGSHEESAERAAFEAGAHAASRGGIILTGGCGGLPYAAARGARSVGGLTVGVSPAMRKDEHRKLYSYPLESDVMLYTGMGRKGRNVILVRSADACLFIGGGMGTLNEFTIAFDELGPECAIGVLAGTGGLSDELSRIVSITGRVPAALLAVDPNPSNLVDILFEHLISYEARRD